MMRIGWIGAGKVGFTLGKYFAAHEIPLSGYYSRSAESAAEAAAFTGSRQFATIPELLSESDVVFLTVPDGSIMEVFRTLRESDISGKQICHCSGALSAEEAFPDIAAYGAEGYSLHPLFPVSSKYHSWLEMGNAWFCIEGSAAHLQDWQTFLEQLGNPVRILRADDKTAYHAACAIASNLICALIAESTGLLETCGFSDEDARAALAPLIQANIRNILQYGAVRALTGPVERGDCGTVQKHLSVLTEHTDRELYRAVSRKLVSLAQEKKPDADYSRLMELLS